MQIHIGEYRAISHLFHDRPGAAAPLGSPLPGRGLYQPAVLDEPELEPEPEEPDPWSGQLWVVPGVGVVLVDGAVVEPPEVLLEELEAVSTAAGLTPLPAAVVAAEATA